MQEEIVIRAKNGDRDAINTLINNHKNMAYSIALKYLKQKADAEDVVQNSFIIVLNAIKNFRSESKFSTWLYKIVYHECLKELKRQQKNPERTSETIHESAADETVYSEIKNVEIKKLLASLQPKEYTIISLFYLKEKSINEIIKITGFSKANVKVILHRARTKMKETVTIEGYQYER